MATETQRPADSPAMVLAKRAFPWVMLVVVALLALRAYSVYKDGAARYEAQQRAAESSATAVRATSGKTSSKSSTRTTGVTAPTQVLIVKDVNFHKDPNLASDNYRMLKAGERLTLLGQTPEWYRVTDSQGNIGWVTVNKIYAKLAKAQ